MYSSNFPFERKFFGLFPFEQANKPGPNVKKLTGRVIRRARQTWVITHNEDHFEAAAGPNTALTALI
jgi:hypothetical protein